MGSPQMLWSWIHDLKRSGLSPWIKIKATAMKVDRCFVVIAISVPAGKAFDFFDLAVDALPKGIRYPVAGIGYNIVQMRF